MVFSVAEFRLLRMSKLPLQVIFKAPLINVHTCPLYKLDGTPLTKNILNKKLYKVTKLREFIDGR